MESRGWFFNKHLKTSLAGLVRGWIDFFSPARSIARSSEGFVYLWNKDMEFEDHRPKKIFYGRRSALKAFMLIFTQRRICSYGLGPQSEFILSKVH